MLFFKKFISCNRLLFFLLFLVKTLSIKLIDYIFQQTALFYLLNLFLTIIY